MKGWSAGLVLLVIVGACGAPENGAIDGGGSGNAGGADAGTESTAQAPDAPGEVHATAADGFATVSWAAPDDHGSPILRYVVTTSPGGATKDVDAPQTTTTIGGLTNGVAYRFSVVATNEKGSSAASELSAPVIPMHAPGAPTAVHALRGDASAFVSWTPPADDGGGAVTGYRVVATPGTASAVAAANATSATVSGLGNGTRYTFVVYAVNPAGESAASAASEEIVPAGPPLAPTNVTAIARDGAAEVSWEASDANGGTVSGYEVTANPGGTSVSVAAGETHALVDGLTNGSPYTFTVRATSDIGTSDASIPSAPVVPATVPAAPQNVRAIARDGSLIVSWDPPADDGGSAVLGYLVSASPGSAPLAVDAPQLTGTLNGLANGTSYTVEVRARNAAGPGESGSTWGIPSAAPSKPTNVHAVRGDHSATITWNAPDYEGASAITQYQIYTPQTGDTVFAGPGERQATIDGLTNGTAYVFRVFAHNANGQGELSAESNQVVPAGAPLAPTNVQVASADRALDVTWSPAPANGDALTAYEISTTPATSTLVVTATTASAHLGGLVNGTSYVVSVRARNSLGNGPSANAAPAVPAGPPDAPVNVTATPGEGTVTIAWEPPASLNGATPSGFIIYNQTTGFSVGVAWSMRSYAFTGLVNGTSYSFKIQVRSSAGDGAPAFVGPVTPATTPGQVASFHVAGGNGTATLNWTAPSADGGSPLTGYEAQLSGGRYAEVGPGTLSYTFTGLMNGAQYSARVVAKNAIGTGTVSWDLYVTPATVPAAPAKVTLALGQSTTTSEHVNVTWLASPDDGGYAIDKYVVKLGTQQLERDRYTRSASFDVNPGQAWTATVTAVNAIGSSAPATSNLLPVAACRNRTFMTKGNFATRSGASRILAADLNGDGRQDIVLSDGRATSTSTEVLWGDGTGALSGPAAIATVTSPQLLAVGDFNGDGAPDVAVQSVTSSTQTTVNLYFNNRNGTFTAGSQPLSFPTLLSLGAAGEFNGQAGLDLVAAQRIGSSATVLAGNGSRFTGSAAYTANPSASYLASADFNGDGRLDVAIASSDANNVSVLLNAGAGFATQSLYPTWKNPFQLAVGDFDNDARPDIVTSSTVDGGGIVAVHNNGDGSFNASSEKFTALSAGVGGAVVTGDFNGDGWLDVALHVSTPGGTQIAWFPGRGDWGFDAPTILPASGGDVNSLVSADFDGDGLPDLATVAGNEVRVLLNVCAP